MLRERRPGTSLSALRPILVVLLAAAALTTGGSRVSAGTNTAVDPWGTTTAVVPGGTLTISVIPPAVTAPQINIASSTQISTCPITGLGTATIVYTCDPAGPGIPAGTALTQTFSTPAVLTPLSGTIPETVTYNATVSGYNATATGASEGPTDCTTSGETGDYQDWSCEANALPTGSGQSLTVYVLADDTSLDVSDLSISGVTCALDSSRTSPNLNTYFSNQAAGVVLGAPGEIVGSHQWARGMQLTYSCANGLTIPGSATFQFDAGTVLPASATVMIAEILGYPAQPPPPTTQTIFDIPGPMLTSINPATGPAGTTITLIGTNLTAFVVTFGGTPGSSTPIGPSGGTTVNLGMVPASNVICKDATSCTANVGSGNPGDVAEISVTNSSGSSNVQDFTYTAAAAPAAGPATSPTPSGTAQTTGTPQLTSVDPASGPPGTTVTLTGTNLKASGVTTVAFGQRPANNVRCNDAGTSCTAKVPSGSAGETAEVTLTTSAGTSNTLKFSYSAAPSPTPGH